MGTMPGDVERLLAKFESGALLRPGTAAPSLVDLAQAVWRIAGVPGIEPTAAARELETRIGATDHLVVVIADGLGLGLLESMPAASFLWQRFTDALHTVYPSTTAVALTSLHTASWPAAHAVTGYWVPGPAAADAVNVLAYATRGDGRPLEALGLRAESIFPRPTLLGLVPRQALFMLPARLVTGGFTDYLAGSAARQGYRSLVDAADGIVQFVSQAAGPTCSVLYVSAIDDAAHQHGPAHLEVVGAVRALDAAVAQMATALGGRARIVLTADHGHLPVPGGSHRVLWLDDEVGRYVRSVTGDTRALTIALRADADYEAFAAAFRARHGEQFLLLTAAEVEQLGLLGPPPLSPTTRERVGDCLAISLGADILEARVPGARRDARFGLQSHHSGMTAAELRIPLIIA